MNPEVSTAVDGGVLTITLDRPKANAINVATSQALYAAFARLQQEPALRVAIITGTGRFFSAGWDLSAAVAGEAIGQTEYDNIDGNIDPVLAEIEGIVYIGDRDDIDDKYFQTIARLVAIHSAAKFSNAPVDLATVRQHENRLRELAASQPTYQTQKGEYF